MNERPADGESLAESAAAGSRPNLPCLNRVGFGTIILVRRPPAGAAGADFPSPTARVLKHPPRLTDRPADLGVIFWLAGPAMAEQGLHMLVGYSDLLLTGRVLPGAGPEHLAAVSSTGYLLWLLAELFVFVAFGSTALIARAIGAGDPALAVRVVNQSLLLGAIGATFVTGVLFVSSEWLVALLGLEATSRQLAQTYLAWIIPSLPFVMLETIAVACLRGAGDTRSGLYLMAVVNVVNIGASWLLLAGFGPIPALGWEGIAIGTACGHAVGGLMGLGFLLRGRAGLRLDMRQIVFDRSLAARILRIGIPGGLDMIGVILCQIWFLSIINRLGPVSGAAHGLALRVESLAFLPGTAFQIAATTLTGQFLGARQPREAAHAVWQTLRVCTLFMIVMGFVFFFGGGWLAAIWVTDSRIIGLATVLLQIIALGMIPLAVQMIFVGALRGAGDTRFPLVINLTGFLAIRIPLAYFFTMYCEWGVVGAWYAMLIDLTLRCSCMAWRFWHGGWVQVDV